MQDALKKIKNFSREHGWIIIASFLLTIIIFAPLLAFPSFIKDKYQGININRFGGDAHFYLTRGKEVLAGNGLGSPVLKEGKNGMDLQLSSSEYILLSPIKLLGLEKKFNIVSIYNFYNFIGVFFLILLIYFLVWQLSGNKLLSIAAALFVVGGYSIVYNKSLFYSDFNVYARVIYPYFSSLILFLYLNFLVLCLKLAKLKYKILASLVFGLLFYIYFYAWTFALAFNVCLFLIYLIRKDFSAAKIILLISGIGLALGSYNLIRLASLLNPEYENQAAYFMAMSYGHGPIFSKIGFIVLIIFVVYWYKRKDDKNASLIFAVILSGWAALNQQIITGKLLQQGHYYWYFIVPLSIIVSFYMIWWLINNEKLKKYLFLALIALVFINTAGGQYKSFFTSLGSKMYEQNFGPIINALNRDEYPGVILAAQSNAYLFTIYTSYDLFWHSAAFLSRVPVQRYEEALFVYLYLNKDARNDFKGYLEKISDYKAPESFYQALYRDLEGYLSGYPLYEYDDKVATDDKELSLKRPMIIEQLDKKYNKAIKDNGVNKILKKYEVNYIVWDKNKYPEWDLSFMGDKIKEVVSFNNIYLYRIL